MLIKGHNKKNYGALNITISLFLVILNFFTAAVGQTSLLAYYMKSGACFPIWVNVGGETKHNLLYSWILYQVLIFYGNFFGQLFFMLVAKTCGVFTIKEKCGGLNNKKEMDFLEYCKYEIPWFNFLAS